MRPCFTKVFFTFYIYCLSVQVLTKVQSTTGSRGVRISGSNAGYTMFQGSVKSTGYPLHSPDFPSLPLPCVTVCHHISTGLYCSRSIVLVTVTILTNRHLQRSLLRVSFKALTTSHKTINNVYKNRSKLITKKKHLHMCTISSLEVAE